MRPASALETLARSQYGGLSGCARAIGVSRSAAYRAAAGRPVSKATQERLEAAFHLPLQDLGKPIVDVILESL
jgi:hypothetical protein